MANIVKPPTFNHPPLGRAVKTSYPTPSIEDVVVVTSKEVNVTGYKVEEYGSAHPDTKRYPNHKLVLIQPAGDDIHAKWFYVADRADQDAYNFALKYKLEDQTSNIYIRQYVLPREGYTPVANGTADSVDVNAKMVHEEILGAADGELAGLYYKVVRVFEHLPGPALLTQDKRNSGYDLIPPEFRQNDNKNVQTQEVATGTVPDNTVGAILESKVEPQDTVKAKKQNTLLVQGTIPVIVSKLTNRARQLSTETKTLVTTGGVVPNPSALQTVTVQDLGNGKSVQIVTVDPSLFTQNRFEATQPDLTPEEFRVNFDDTTTVTTAAGTAAPPVLDPTSLSESDEQIDTFTHRTSTTNRPRPTLPASLAEKDTNDVKQNVTVTKTLQTTAAGQAVPSATQDVTVKNLGDGRVVQVVRSVPSVFSADSHEKEQPDVTPIDFRATLEQATDETTVIGTAGVPTLGNDDLSASEKQVNAFVKRTSRTSRPHPGLPATLVNKETDRDKQVITVTRKLRAAGTDPIPDATTSVEVTNLGDSRELEVVRTIPSVFARKSFVADRGEVTPKEFLFSNPVTETSIDAAGPAVAPTLGTSDLSATQEQVDAFVKRTRTRSRTLPTSSSTSGRKLVEDYGGGIALVTRKLQAQGTEDLIGEDTDPLVVSANVEDLGNNMEVSEVVKVTAANWPSLHNDEIDRDLDIPVSVVKQVVPVGTEVATIGAYFDIQYKSVDSRRRQKITSGFNSSAAMTGYKRIWAGTVDVSLPAELTAITAQIAGSTAGGGTGSGSGSFTGVDVNIRETASCQSSASAAIAFSITPTIRQRNGDNVPCSHVVFLMADGLFTMTDVLARLTTLTGTTVNQWPKFSPRPVFVTLVGNKVRGSATASVGVSAGIRQDFQGALVVARLSNSGNVGAEDDRSVTIQTERIGPTIHPRINITGTASGSADSGSQSAGAFIPGVPGATTSARAIAVGGVSGDIPPTTGATSVPNAGWFLYRCSGEPYKFGQNKMHCILINAADIPSA